jgi:two-component sensor histidine kinase
VIDLGTGVTRIGFVKRAVLAPARSLPLSVLLVVAAIAVPTAVRLAINPLLHGHLPYVMYLPFILLVTVALGWRAATLVVASLAILTRTVASRGGDFDWSSQEVLIGFVLFVISSTFIIAMGQTLRRALIELEATAKREAVLATELAHRGKNYLALVDALARQCQREERSAPDFFAALLPRLQALARAQDLLTRSKWSACALRWLVDEALLPFVHHPGIVIDGPDFLVPPESCMPLVMALHELATNASKYGALSVPEGHVSLTWTRLPDGTCQLFWVERDGPRVTPPARRGLGSRLITREPAFSDVDLAFPPEGVCCTIGL